MAKIVGSVDHRGRPLVRIAGTSDDILVTVDTGFNGDLFLSPEGARSLGISATERATLVELGDGSTTLVDVARTTLDWLDARRPVRVLITSLWRPGAEDPVGLIGTGLLTPHLLLIDFGGRTVEIETQD